MEDNRFMNNGAGMNAGIAEPARGGTNSTSTMADDPYQINVTVIARGGLNGTSIYGADEGGDGSISQLQLNLIGYLLMSTFFLILSIVLGLLVYSILRRRHLLSSLSSLYGEQQERANSGGAPSRSMLLRIQRRYETIEHWIITKKVQPHDGFCEKVVTNFGHHVVAAAAAKDQLNSSHSNNDTAATTSSSSSSSSECNDAATTPNQSCLSCQPALESDHEQRECPICMSALTKGQIVSWSANEKCSHVYHHQCIKEWLLRHVECCLCKHTFLPVDMKKGHAKEAALQELSCEYAAASATSYYCNRTGLIRIPRSVRCTKTELHMLEQRIFEGTVPPAKLALMRGSREASTSRNEDGLLIVPMVATATGFRATTAIDGQVDQPELELPSASIDHSDPTEASTSISQEQQQQQEQQQHRPQSETVQISCPASSPTTRDVELGGDQELLTASYHLELEKSRIGDNRCCILHDSSDDSVEVKETSSSGHIREEEELSDHHDMVDRMQREDF